MWSAKIPSLMRGIGEQPLSGKACGHTRLGNLDMSEKEASRRKQFGDAMKSIASLSGVSHLP